MATLTVWRFDTAGGARAALELLDSLMGQHLVQVDDAALVTWPRGRESPRTEQVRGADGSGRSLALGGSFWGLLFGLVFFVPLLGIAVGAGAGAMAGSHLAGAGIDDRFVDEVRKKVTPGTSALFVLSSHAVVETAVGRLRAVGAELVSTSLSPDEEARLRKVFAGDRG
ncbi:Uncharacterized membrane protein [Amycolatopsis xylanica]|uniref:Uncharacterized membrane protein n=1 Tax=Amycolatopsis xylanica TaxID=589385 RepID=A0A1H3L513_9PSEU|nr:DUF1269 domain-containing protein [Amycolatopsis xylanica]SDY59532.1 Uncharacterized membrane protein [Amycolatopsis xylanica]